MKRRVYIQNLAKNIEHRNKVVRWIVFMSAWLIALLIGLTIGFVLFN